MLFLIYVQHHLIRSAVLLVSDNLINVQMHHCEHWRINQISDHLISLTAIIDCILHPWGTFPNIWLCSSYSVVRFLPLMIPRKRFFVPALSQPFQSKPDFLFLFSSCHSCCTLFKASRGSFLCDSKILRHCLGFGSGSFLHYGLHLLRG